MARAGRRFVPLGTPCVVTSSLGGFLRACVVRAYHSTAARASLAAGGHERSRTHRRHSATQRAQTSQSVRGGLREMSLIDEPAPCDAQCKTHFPPPRSPPHAPADTSVNVMTRHLRQECNCRPSLQSPATKREVGEVVPILDSLLARSRARRRHPSYRRTPQRHTAPHTQST